MLLLLLHLDGKFFDTLIMGFQIWYCLIWQSLINRNALYFTHPNEIEILNLKATMTLDSEGTQLQ